MQLAKLADLVTIQSGYAPRGRGEPDPDADYALLKVSDISDDGEFDPGMLDRYVDVSPGSQHLLREGDVVFATRGAHNWAVYVPADMPDVAATSHLYIIRAAEGTADPAYLAWYLNQRPAQAYFEALSTGTHVARVNKEVLQGLEIPLPSLDEQRQIARAGHLAIEEYRLALEHASRRRELVESILLDRLATP